MDQFRKNRFILTILSLGDIGLCVDSYLSGWEFWVPPLLILAVIFMWIMHVTQFLDNVVQEIVYFGVAMFSTFFFGVHNTTFFFILPVVCVCMCIFSFTDHIYMMNLLLFEFFILFAMQIFMSFSDGNLITDPGAVTRIIVHIAIGISVCVSCIRSIQMRQSSREEIRDLEDRLKANDRDMDDFLSNISHELRTPVNVVNGMSDLLLKRGGGEEAFAVKEAGLRLTGQIDDIQDYTETRQHDVFNEEEDYMITSLINDVVTSFRMNRENRAIELVVDLSAYVPAVMRGDVKKLRKIFRHLLSNGVKFTKDGAILIKVYSEEKEYGINLCIEVTDTGSGMDREGMSKAMKGMYQANKKRDRSSGGVGLGLPIVYGFAHSMGGFVKIESTKGLGTTVRVTIPQGVINPEHCLALDAEFRGSVLFHVRSDKYRIPRMRDFYRSMASSLAEGIKVPLYPAESIKEVERLMEKLDVSFIFMGEEEYLENASYFDEKSHGDVVITVSASEGFLPNPGSAVVVMPKPLYAYPVIKILNEGKDAKNTELSDEIARPSFRGLKVLVVDDEPMNLVVATGLFKDYDIVTDTAESGAASIEKCRDNRYDIVFMDHMMPEMDGVEAMKHIKRQAKEMGRGDIPVVSLTANVVSGAREMFINEGFDGFIGKPINTNEFERVIKRLLPIIKANKGGGSL